VRAAIELVPVAGEPVRASVARMVASCADEDLLEAYLGAAVQDDRAPKLPGACGTAQG
jgi:hypothetical protein